MDFSGVRPVDTASIQILQHLIDQAHLKYTHAVAAPATSSSKAPSHRHVHILFWVAMVSLAAAFTWRERTSRLPSPKLSIKDLCARIFTSLGMPPLDRFNVLIAS
jgi:hypothetical protein